MKKTRSKAALAAACIPLLLFLAGGAAAHGHQHHKPEKKGILLVAFGSSVEKARTAFGHVDSSVREKYPDIAVRWAYTSRIVRSKLAQQGETIASPAEALARMAAEGFTHVAVQSLHTIAGAEFHELLRTVRGFEAMDCGIQDIAVGRPLLGGAADMQQTAEAVREVLPQNRRAGEAVVLMGHGSHHPANTAYAALMWQLQQNDENLFVATVEGSPKVGRIIDRLKAKGIEKAWLMPFMSVAGDHARNDMAGSGKASWVSRFKAAGIRAEPVLKGTAESDSFIRIWTAHLQTALADL